MNLLVPLSIREWMRLVVLAALGTLLFKGLGQIIFYPPVTIFTVIFLLALSCTWVRPRSLNRAVIAAMGVGLLATLAVCTYLAEAKLKPRMAAAILDRLPESIYQAVPASLRSSSGVYTLDFLLLDLMAFLAMILAAWIARPGRGRLPAQRQGRQVRRSRTRVEGNPLADATEHKPRSATP